MGFISKQLLKVIEWKDSAQDTMAYRHPMDDRTEIMNGCQLIVRPSQLAVLVKEGKIADVFEAGRYKLETKNIPILTTLMGWKYGFDSPFKCDVYFINTTQFINQLWGTSSPITMRDQDFGVVRFRSHGTYSFKVGNPQVFITELSGTSGLYSVTYVSDQLRKYISSVLSQAVAKSQIPLLDLSMHFSDIADVSKELVKPKFESIGMELIDITVGNITLDEESEKALTQRSKMNIIGNAQEYTQYAAADAMTEMSKNAHKGQGNIGGMGMGMGFGMAMNNMMGGAMNTANMPSSGPTAQDSIEKLKKSPTAPAAPASDERACPKCGALNKVKVKFCSDCGAKMSNQCPKCGVELEANAKFCGECGESMVAKPANPVCPHCNAKLREGAKFCTACGKKV